MKKRFKINFLVDTRCASQSNRVCRIVVTSWLLLDRLKYDSLSLTYWKVEVRFLYIVIVGAPDKTREDFYQDRNSSCLIERLRCFYLNSESEFLSKVRFLLCINVKF